MNLTFEELKANKLRDLESTSGFLLHGGFLVDMGLSRNPNLFKHAEFGEEDMKIFVKHFKPICLGFVECAPTLDVYCEAAKRYEQDYRLMADPKDRNDEAKMIKYGEDEFKKLRKHYHLVCYKDNWSSIRTWRDVKKSNQNKQYGLIHNFSCMNHVEVAIDSCLDIYLKLDVDHHGLNKLHCRFRNQIYDEKFYECNKCRLPTIEKYINPLKRTDDAWCPTPTKSRILFGDIACWFKGCTPAERLELIQTKLPFKELSYNVPLSRLIGYRREYNSFWFEPTDIYDKRKQRLAEIEEEMATYPQYDELANLDFDYSIVKTF